VATPLALVDTVAGPLNIALGPDAGALNVTCAFATGVAGSILQESLQGTRERGTRDCWIGSSADGCDAGRHS